MFTSCCRVSRVVHVDLTIIEMLDANAAINTAADEAYLALSRLAHTFARRSLQHCTRRGKANHGLVWMRTPLPLPQTMVCLPMSRTTPRSTRDITRRCARRGTANLNLNLTVAITINSSGNKKYTCSCLNNDSKRGKKL
jgi:hypothetical protein